MPVRFIFALVFLVLLEPLAAIADNSSTISEQDPSCACIADGKRFSQGETICLNGLSMTCGTNQNISAWVSKGKQCSPDQLRS
jgi:hypothetical protein